MRLYNDPSVWKNPNVGVRWSMQRLTYGTKPRRRATKGFMRPVFAWNRCVLLQKLPLHLYTPQIVRAQTKGETTPPRFRSLVCSYCPVGEKIKTPSLRYIHHLTSLTRVGSVRWVCGDLAGFFWSSAYSVLKRHQEKVPLIFFFLPPPPRPLLFWLLLNFWAGSRQGVLPVGAVSIVPLKTERVKTDCFKWKWGIGTSPKKSLPQLFPLALPGEVLQSDFAVFCQEFGLFFHEKAVPVLLPTQT